MTAVEPLCATIPWLVFSDDWGRHPTSCQHLIRHALPNQPVTWVNMIGTRRPKFDRATVRRGFEKFGQWMRPGPKPGKLPDNLNVVSPKIWPGFGRSWERRLNRAWLVRQLRPIVEDMPEPPIAIATMPTAADLVGSLPVRRWVYYCVDDFSVWPGIDQAAARRLEDQFIDTADAIVAVSDALAERVEKRGRTAHLLTHGVDLEFWLADTPSSPSPLPRSGEGSKRILFWGLIDRRMDVEFVRAAAAENSITLVGPEDDPDPALKTLPNVELRPAAPLAELPGLAASADVLVMPYVDAPVTRAMQPLKLKEYLATGKPVVVRDLPANREWADALDLASSPEQFARMIRERLKSGLPESQRDARRRLADETWEAKSHEFMRLVSAVS